MALITQATALTVILVDGKWCIPLEPEVCWCELCATPWLILVSDMEWKFSVEMV
jgi:hypothetical protein